MSKPSYVVNLRLYAGEWVCYGPFADRNATLNFLKEKGFRKLHHDEGWGLTTNDHYRDEDEQWARIVRLRKSTSIRGLKRRKKIN